MKTPTVCESLQDVRSAIDHIDQQIVALLGLRAEYVKTAARFKPSESQVAAPDRQAAMLTARREWAQRENLDPDFIETLYHDIVTHFVARERDHWKDNYSGT